ncbi:MAG: hypothetical protein L3K02_01725 [Thermoplasmata archaeon]|nr:hypothetical protein [Thermoplasmata archaeon]
MSAPAAPVELVPRRPTRNVLRIGTVRLPIAGPYRPVARLFLFPDGRLLWHVRLWEYDRAVSHLVATRVLIAFAREQGLLALEQEIARLVRSVREGSGARD